MLGGSAAASRAVLGAGLAGTEDFVEAVVPAFQDGLKDEGRRGAPQMIERPGASSR